MNDLGPATNRVSTDPGNDVIISMFDNDNLNTYRD